MDDQLMLGPYSHVPLGPGGPGGPGGGAGSGLAEGASGMDAAAEMVGTIRCAGCAGAAGDYLGPPDLSNACSWCGGRLPLCDRCARAVSFSAIGETGGGGGDGVSGDEMIAAEAVCCCGCARLVCSGPECSTRCSNTSCETVFCSSCRLSLSECSGCLMPHCRRAGDPDTDCLLPCQGHPECREGCNADRCLLCVMRSRPCDMCGHPVSADRVREHMASTTGFIEKWSKFCLGKNSRRREESVAAVAGASAGPSEVHHPPRSIALRAEVAHRWMSVAAGRGASAGGSCAAVAGGAGTGVGGAGIGAAGAAAAGVASGASGVRAGSAVFAAGVSAAAAGATAAGAAAGCGVGGGGSVAAGAAGVGPAAAGVGAGAAGAAGCRTAGSGASAAAGADMGRANTSTLVPHAAEALQTKPPPAAIPQPTKPAAAAAAESAIGSVRAVEEIVPVGSAGHGEGVRGAAVGESADESWLLGASVLRILEQARKALGGGQGGRRLPVEHVRQVVAMWEEEEEEEGDLAGVRRSTLRGVTSVETVKALFSGWVESDVVDLYHGGSEDVRQTLKQCRETMEQVVAIEHAASTVEAWTMYTSPDHDNRPYWHNAQKNEATWENPFEQQQRLQEVQQSQAQPRGATAAAGGGEEGGAESSSSASTTVSQLAKDGDSMAESWKAGGFNHGQFTSWMGRALRTRSEIQTRHEEGKSGGGLAKFSAPVQDSPRSATNDVRWPLAAWPESSVATRVAAQVPQASAAAVGEDRREKAGPAAANAGAANAGAASAGAASAGAAGGGSAGGAAGSVARAAVPSSNIPRATTGREQKVPSPAAVETKKAPAVEAAGLKPAGQETAAAAAAAAAVAKKPAAAKAAEQPPPPQQLLKRGASAGKTEAAAAAAGAVRVGTLEAQMADLQAAEERKQAAKAKKAARRAEEAAEREDREMQEAVARKEAAARRREATAAAAARTKAEAAARETARIAEAKAATEARVMAAVAAQAKAEKEAKEAAKKTAKENDDLQQANRAKRQERAKAVADAKAANEARAAEKAQREERAAAAEAAAAAAVAAGPAMRGGGVGGGGALLAHMSLEVRLKKAIDSGVSEAVGWPSNTLAVQSIYDEADQTPGASIKKIKKKCKKWLNKKEGENSNKD
ncbi:unnamed protein product [Ectocarpus sp. CCAP 1310/34]|nr:unnamed protein product [Ectocarpus sp. CCAP 1310/34]